MKKDLIVFIAHIDDFECACYGYVFKHHKEYDKIKIVTATTWAKKLPVWGENLKLFPKEILSKIEDINLDVNIGDTVLVALDAQQAPGIKLITGHLLYSQIINT